MRVTRLARVTLRIPQDRECVIKPTRIAQSQRHKQALLTMLAKGYTQGVPTSKVRAVVEAIYVESVSVRSVIREPKQLDVTLASWRTSRVDG
jgi:transposase-like protein